MTLALQRGDIVKALVSVDNAPVDANLRNDFYTYIEGLKEVEEAGVAKQADADAVLKKFEKVHL